jgi:hypothetical protein
MDKTIEKLKSLKSIMPDADFASISRSVILSSVKTVKTKRSFIYDFGMSIGVMATAVTIAVLLGNVRTPSAILAVSNFNTVENEAATIGNDIDVVLQEIGSFDRSAKKTALALNEAAGNGPAHLNESILSAEIEKLDINPSAEQDVETLLNKAIF